MEIKSLSKEIIITGNIKTMKDFQEIKACIDAEIRKRKDLTIKIVDSLSITSSVIGYFSKIINKDGINLNLSVGDDQLLNLIDDLNLTSMFKAKKA